MALFKTVSNPKLTPDVFSSKLTLTAVNVTGNMLDFFYEDENMFWGHSVIVNSMDGIAFTDTHAEIFGEAEKTRRNHPMHPSGEVGRFDNGQFLVAAG